MMCLSEYPCPLLFYIRELNCLSEATQRKLLEELEVKLELYFSALWILIGFLPTKELKCLFLTNSGEMG